MMDQSDRELFVGLWEQLKRIADALDRAVPFEVPVDYSQVKPADLGDYTVVTPALRKQWADEEEQATRLGRDLVKPR